MNYFELLKLAAPEAIVVLTALVVLTIGLMTGRQAAGASMSVTSPPDAGGRRAAARDFVRSPRPWAGAGGGRSRQAAGTLGSFHGMLVISPLNSLFQLICLVLAFFTVLLARGERPLPNHGEYLAMILLGTVGLLLLVGSEELLMIFIGLELTGLSLYVLTAFDKTRSSLG